jgi:nucleotidyltransferase substrate binding protein (TIGR01987 family)
MRNGVMNEAKTKPRWIYRFDNYKRAFSLLREAIETMQDRELLQLEKEGVIQRFEYTWELAWKVLKDYLEAQGVVLDTIAPSFVLRAALEAKLITNGDLWMQALDARNKMSHVYNMQKFEDVIQQIQKHYLALLDDLHLSMMERVLSESYSTFP